MRSRCQTQGLVHANIEATLVAMREREPLIVNGRLPRAGTMAGPVVSYELDDASEAELAAQFIDQLRNIITDAETAGRTVRIFHWADPERSRTRIPDPGPTHQLEHSDRHCSGSGVGAEGAVDGKDGGRANGREPTSDRELL